MKGRVFQEVAEFESWASGVIPSGAVLQAQRGISPGTLMVGRSLPRLNYAAVRDDADKRFKRSTTEEINRGTGQAYEVSEESGTAAIAPPAEEGAEETDGEPGVAPAAMALAFLPFTGVAGNAGTFILSTTW